MPDDPPSQSPTTRAHAIVARLPNTSPWHLHPALVRERLHELVDHPDRLRQSPLNLCGPAAMMTVWLRRDPVAAVTFAATLWREGQASIGDLPVHPRPGLPRARPPDRAHAADYLLLASLRDAANRVLAYRGGTVWREAPAAITLPGPVARWLAATGLYQTVRNETSLLWPRPVPHALGLNPGQDVLLLVASELLHERWRAGHHVRSLLPNHWVGLRSVISIDRDTVRARLWSWGQTFDVAIPRARFARCYHGAVIADPKTVAAAAIAP